MVSPRSSEPSSEHIRLSWEDPGTGLPQSARLTIPLTIGRAADNDLTLSSSRLSRYHARISLESTGVVLTDLESTNGTFVNQERVTRTALKDGDAMRLGPFTVTIDLPPFAGTAGSTEPLYIHWRDGRNGGMREILLKPPLTIGRGSDNNVVLAGERVSRRHAVILQEPQGLVIVDQNSKNGFVVNGKVCRRALLVANSTIQIGKHELRIEGRERDVAQGADEAPGTLVFDENSDELIPLARLRSVDQSFPPTAFDQQQVSVSDLSQSGIDLEETTYLAIGGGLGSFAWVDHLRIFGVAADRIRVLGLEEKPFGRYQRLCRHSQIPGYERLRSDSSSTPDNVWGWPGYAMREIVHSLKQARVGNAARVAWQIFGEPTLSQTYTPRSQDVFDSIEREAERIGWQKMWRFGHVKAIRKTDDGRYAVAYTSTTPGGRRRCIVIASYVHVAVGYPGVRFLPDLQKYRDETGDFQSVVNAYEEHEHVYEKLERTGGVVVLRGRGIVASRILQRLFEARKKQPDIAIMHLMRTPLRTGNRFGLARRQVEHHWEFQPFNWPKSCWGGELRQLLEQAIPEERELLLNDWGGTTTADRRDWRRIVGQGLHEGWYEIRFGNVKEVQRNEAGQVVTYIKGEGAIAEEMILAADFIIDSTGLQAELDANPLLKDLTTHYSLPRNPKGRMHVANSFEIPGMRNGNGRIFASGVMTLGGPFAAADSFLGLQYAALRSVDALAAAGAPNLRRLNGVHSTLQWLRWARGVAP